MRCVLEVKFNENDGALHQFKRRGDEWKWVSVINGNVVQTSNLCTSRDPYCSFSQRKILPLLVRRRFGSDQQIRLHPNIFSWPLSQVMTESKDTLVGESYLGVGQYHNLTVCEEAAMWPWSY